MSLLNLQFPVAALNTGDIVSRGDSLTLVDAPVGVYTAVLTVLDAEGVNELSQSTTTFIVNRTSLQSVSGTVVANPYLVFHGDPLTCTDTVSNISALNPVQADIIQRLINLDTGTVVHESTYAADLGASETEILVRDIDSNILELGGYSCALFAEANGEETLLSFDQFTVLEPPIQIAIEMTQRDRGRILILLDEPGYFVDEEQCLFVEQVSMQLPDHPVVEDGAQVTVRLFDDLANLLESEMFVYTGHAVFEDENVGEPNLTVDVAKSGMMSVNLDSVVEVNGSYQIGIEIDVNDQVETYDSGVITFNCSLANQFQRTFGDIRITAMDAQPAVKSDEPFGPKEASTLNRQRTFLEELLNGAGWIYTIVTSAESFVTEFRTGSYNLYGIFAEKEKLPTDFQGEVREAVYRGEGLVVAGLHDHRDSKIELPLGINAIGKHNDAQSVVVEDTELAPASSATILLGESVMRVELSGAQSAARFTLDGNPDVADIAVAFFNYDQGHSVFGAVDLLVQAVEAGNGSSYEDLILRGFDFAYDPISATTAGSAVPIKLILQNEGIAIGGQIVFSLPDGSELLGASALLTQQGSQYIWPFELEDAANIELEIWISMPAVPGDLIAQIQIGAMEMFEDYETISFTLAPDENVSADQIAVDLDALYMAEPGTYHIAKQTMDRALAYLTDENYESALRELMKVTLELDGVGMPESDAVHLSLAQLVRQVAFNLQLPPQL